jgi:hypothetical protein
MMPPLLTYKYQWYLLILILAGSVVVGTLGGVYFGARTITENTNILEKQIFDHGYNVGFAAGLNQSSVVCNAKLHSLAADCKEWELPPEKLGINLTGGP